MKLFRKLFGGLRKATSESGAEIAAAGSDQDQFAALVIEALERASPTLIAVYDPLAFELRHGEGSHRTLLHNSFAEYRRVEPRDRQALIERLVAFIIECGKPHPEGDDALDALLPVLRPRADLLVTFEGGPAEFPYKTTARPFCDTMFLMLAIDTPISIALVNDDTLRKLGISFDDALGIAIGHLDERGGHDFGQVGDGSFVTTCEDHYDASRVLIPGLLSQLPVRGNPVAIVESRSWVLVTGSEDMDGLAQIAGYALDDFPDNERAVSLAPIELVDGAWRPFAVEPHHPIPVRNLVRHQQAWQYGATQEFLQGQLGDDLYVAGVMMVTSQADGETLTYASWADGVPTACPMVDAVIIEASGPFSQITRSMTDVLAVCSPTPIDAMPYPPRVMLPGNMDFDRRRDLTDNYPEFAGLAG